MLCKGVVPEVSGTKSCWLPVDRSSYFQLCRRCHFHHVTRVLDRLTTDYTESKLHPQNEMLLNQKEFLDDLLHPAREQALLNLLLSLYNENKILFTLLVSRLKLKTVFPILITKRIQNHSFGTKCEMYQQFLQDSKVYTSDTLCGNCWHCISWVLKKNDPRLIQLYMNTFSRHIVSLTYGEYQISGSNVFLELVSWQYLRNFHHHLRIVLHQFFLVFPHEEYRRFLTRLFQKHEMLSSFFTKEYFDMIPPPLRDDLVHKDLQNELFQWIRKKTNTYKEELMMKTWHPSRFIEWCFDIEERKDHD